MRPAVPPKLANPSKYALDVAHLALTIISFPGNAGTAA
jgi:hypothetical protein